MTQKSAAVQAAGAALALGAVMLIITFVIHGAPEPRLSDMMAVIAAESLRWQLAHWFAAVGLSLFAMAGIILLGARTRLAESPFTVFAWGMFAIGALWTSSTAVAEATAVTHVAVAGDEAAFAAWWAFSEGRANGFAALALAVAVIAGEETRTAEKATPVWAAGVAAVAACGSFIGWVLNAWAGIGFGGPIWVASSILMCLWLLWLGTGLVRAETHHAANRRDAPSGA
ncbi:hypothetical protein [Chelativorans salis]|uniref:DUF998 domain-containing protein n=1 Tax=Chelativorans salis TaxID=2978478 RepID=A0ABT2LLV7_9HYPH|nr:hypothetical protein [Chelativorans sp. EGI FJ00035]MCT7374164.1 hypothetical protein [Chelativorans sp. EGI FJ00035]